MRATALSLLLFTGQALFGQSLRSYEVGEWRVKLGVPYVNSILLQPADEGLRTRTGWVGLEAGIEHQCSVGSFLALDVSLNGAAQALGLMDREGEFDRYTSGSLNLSNNSTCGRISVGYGLSVARNTWSHTRTLIADSIPPSRPLVDRSSTDLGLVFNGYYRIGRAFHAGLIYRPFFYKFDTADPWQYEHVISLDLMWRIRLGHSAQPK